MNDNFFTADKNAPTGDSPENRIAMPYKVAIVVFSGALFEAKFQQDGTSVRDAQAWVVSLRKGTQWDDAVAEILRERMEKAPVWAKQWPQLGTPPQPLWVKLVPDDAEEYHIAYPDGLEEYPVKVPETDGSFTFQVSKEDGELRFREGSGVSCKVEVWEDPVGEKEAPSPLDNAEVIIEQSSIDARITPPFVRFKAYYAKNRDRFGFAKRKRYDELAARDVAPKYFKFSVNTRKDVSSGASYERVIYSYTDLRGWTEFTDDIDHCRRYKLTGRDALDALENEIECRFEVTHPEIVQALFTIARFKSSLDTFTLIYHRSSDDKVLWVKAWQGDGFLMAKYNFEIDGSKES